MGIERGTGVKVMCGLLNTKNTREQTTNLRSERRQTKAEPKEEKREGGGEGGLQRSQAKSKSKLYLDDDDMQKRPSREQRALAERFE